MTGPSIPTLEDLAEMVNICRDLDITPSTVLFQRSGLAVWTLSSTARTDAERIAAQYGALLVEDKPRRRRGYTDWFADVVVRDKVKVVTVHAASFDHHDDWQEPT